MSLKIKFYLIASQGSSLIHQYPFKVVCPEKQNVPAALSAALLSVLFFRTLSTPSGKLTTKMSVALELCLHGCFTLNDSLVCSCLPSPGPKDLAVFNNNR